MFLCPNCSTKFVKTKAGQCRFWRCPKCDGRSTTLSVLRKHIPRDIVNNLWQSARSYKAKGRRPCPACNKRMVEVPVPGNEAPVFLDVCTRCQFIWFDPKEFEALPRLAPATGELSPEAKEVIAMRQIESAATIAREQDHASQEPDELWQYLPALFGMPVEHDTGKIRSLPWITWILAFTVTIVSLFAFTNLHQTAMRLGLIPAMWNRDMGLTLITSFFIHGGILHLVGNMYFFLVFGDNVEDSLGKVRFIILLLLADLVGSFAHIMADPSSMAPCIGASGGISGILAYYAMRFPHAKLGFMIYFRYVFRWVRVPAIALFLLWIILQLFGAMQQLDGFTNVSALSHLGGAGVGVLFYLLTFKE